jgi:hypothetical protein
MRWKQRCVAVFAVGVTLCCVSESEAQLPDYAWDYLTRVNSGQQTQTSPFWMGTQQQVAGEDCAGGEIYDDGVAENGYSGNPGLISQVDIVQLFNPGSSSLFYVTACVAYTTLAGSDLDLEIVALANDGGTPGAEIASMAESITGIVSGLPGEWFGFDITSMNLNVTEPIFVGVRHNPMAFPSRFVLADESAGTPLHTGFVNFNQGSGWQATQTVFPNFRAQLIRLVAGEPVPTMPPPALLAALAGLLLFTMTRMLRRTTVA